MGHQASWDLGTGSVERPDGERDGLFYGDDRRCVVRRMGFSGESLCEAEDAGGAACACNIVAGIALVAWCVGRLVFYARDAKTFSLYETGRDGWFACGGGAQFWMGFEPSKRGRCQRERL